MAGASTFAFAQPAPRSEPAGAQAGPDDEDTVSELVITADPDRPQPGAVVGDIKPELQLDPADIQSYGVSTLTQLLDEIAPQTRSERGRGGEAPVILLNGRRISGFREIRDLPTEAIQRVDVLPEEVALKYGYSASQRVVNIVLRRFFRALTAEAAGGGSTAGGTQSGQVELNALRIRRDTRFNLDLKVSGQTALTEDERDLVSRTAGLGFDPAGNVVPAAGTAEIDPALSSLVGHPVVVAGIPETAATGAPLSLADFAATADQPNVSDVGRFRTLVPSSREVSLNTVYSTPLFAGIAATFNGSLEAKRSESLQGLPGVDLIVPAGDPFSPFGQPVKVERAVTALGPLRQTNDSWSAHLGATFNRDMGQWRLSLTSAYDHSDGLTHSDTGLIATVAQTRLDALDPTFDPFAPPPEALLDARPEDKARSLSDGFNAQVLANGPLLELPAGRLFASFKVGDSQSWFSSNSLRAGVDQTVDLSRNNLNGQASLDAPLVNRKHGPLAALGDLSVNGNASFEDLSDFGTLTTLGYGLSWKPVTVASLIVSHTREEAAPSFQQLGGPVVITPGSRIFDYVTGRTVDVRRVDGGNSDLQADRRKVLKVGVNLQPLASENLRLSANYVHSRTDSPIRSFPAVTAEIEAAFPDRFIRDASGQLVQVDLRPVNFASETVEDLRWGFNYSKRFGPQPRQRFARPNGGPGEGRGGAPRGGGPRGGGFRGGRFGAFGGRTPPTVVQFALYHTVYFEDEFLIRPGGPRLDLLHGSAASANGGQPRNEVEAQAGFLKNGFGVRFSANWKSGTSVTDASAPANDLTFSDVSRVNLRLFADLGARQKLTAKYPFFRGARATFAVSNLFDEHVRVRDASGATPISYQAAYLDPVGRKVTISFRKLFF